MSSKTLTILIIFVLLAMGTIFILNIRPLLLAHSAEKYVKLNDIRGMAVVHQGLEYTLNFTQQNEVAFLLNGSVPVSETVQASKFQRTPFEQIRIFLFNSPNIEITPIGFDGNNLVFSSPTWSSSSYLKDVSNGALKNVLINSYDR